ncbi:hypothetical protein BC629DRAFT_1586720 [Irpex lacteus]|nr:hypothetical protein BC629DRAFT_1586720 [Irpex lacteus]
MPQARSSLIFDATDNEASHTRRSHLQWVLSSSSPHGRMNNGLPLAAGTVLTPALFSLPSLPSLNRCRPLVTIDASTQHGTSPRSQLFCASLLSLWFHIPGSLGTTTILSNHRDPGGDRLVSFRLISLRSAEYLNTPAVLKARQRNGRFVVSPPISVVVLLFMGRAIGLPVWSHRSDGWHNTPSMLPMPIR